MDTSVNIELHDGSVREQYKNRKARLHLVVDVIRSQSTNHHLNELSLHLNATAG